MLSDETVRKFNEMLASSEPTPGGGGAAALAGALASGLSVMVSSVTQKKTGDDPALSKLSDGLRELQEKLLSLVDEDAAAVSELLAAYSLPENSPGREGKLEKSLISAAEVPQSVLRLCCEALELTYEVSKLGQDCVLSDAGCAAAMFKAATEASTLNVYANTRLMKNREKAEELDSETEKLARIYGRLADEVFSGISERMRQIL